VSRQRFAVAESLALQVYPWPALALELEMVDAVAGFSPGTAARLPRALLWAVAQFYGDAGSEMFDRLYPSTFQPLQGDEWLGILSSVPLTLDDLVLGRLVALLEAVRRIISDETAEERADFRRELIDAARGMKPQWADWIDGARKQEDGLNLINIAPGWFRVEDPRATAALKRVLGRNRRAP
jgi:hypothetical protein